MKLYEYTDRDGDKIDIKLAANGTLLIRVVLSTQSGNVGIIELPLDERIKLVDALIDAPAF